MTNIENNVKARQIFGSLAPLLTYGEITDNPAVFLGVAIPFLENNPAENRHARHSWENNLAPPVGRETIFVRARLSPATPA